DGDRHSDRHQDLQLARHDVWREYPLHNGDVLRRRVHRDVHHWRYLGRYARLARRGHATPGHVLRGRAHSLRALRRRDDGHLLRDRLLVPEDDRALPGRDPGQVVLLDHLYRHERHVLPDALPGRVRYASTYLHVRGGAWLGHVEPGRHARVVHPGVRCRDLRHQLLHGDAPAADRLGQPVGWLDAGVGHDLTPARAQLRRDPGGPGPRSAL